MGVSKIAGGQGVAIAIVTLIPAAITPKDNVRS